MEDIARVILPKSLTQSRTSLLLVAALAAASCSSHARFIEAGSHEVPEVASASAATVPPVASSIGTIAVPPTGTEVCREGDLRPECAPVDPTVFETQILPKFTPDQQALLQAKFHKHPVVTEVTDPGPFAAAGSHVVEILNFRDVALCPGLDNTELPGATVTSTFPKIIGSGQYGLVAIAERTPAADLAVQLLSARTCPQPAIGVSVAPTAMFDQKDRMPIAGLTYRERAAVTAGEIIYLVRVSNADTRNVRSVSVFAVAHRTDGLTVLPTISDQSQAEGYPPGVLPAAPWGASFFYLEQPTAGLDNPYLLLDYLVDATPVN